MTSKKITFDTASTADEFALLIYNFKNENLSVFTDITKNILQKFASIQNNFPANTIENKIALILERLSPEISNQYKDFQLIDLVNDDKLRYIISIALSKNNIEASEVNLQVTQRTFYRKFVEFNLNPKAIRDIMKKL
jgi:hypothetical protein